MQRQSWQRQSWHQHQSVHHQSVHQQPKGQNKEEPDVVVVVAAFADE
jgi:hypothetical protein